VIFVEFILQGKTDYFSSFFFENVANFERTFFEEASFSKAKFSETVSFSFSNLIRVGFQKTVFDKLSIFIHAVFAIDGYQNEKHVPINGSIEPRQDSTFIQSKNPKTHR
jgi:hypothetical protein